MGLFLRHIELFLTAIAILVVVSAGQAVAGTQSGGPMGMTALAVIVLLGLGGTLAMVRRKQRLARDLTIGEVQTMLKDVINNQLVVIQMADQINRRKPGAVSEAAVKRSVGVIHEAVASLSQESIHAWTLKYRQARRRQGQDSWIPSRAPNSVFDGPMGAMLPPSDPEFADIPTSERDTLPLSNSEHLVPVSAVRLTSSDQKSEILISDIREIHGDEFTDGAVAAGSDETPILKLSEK